MFLALINSRRKSRPCITQANTAILKPASTCSPKELTYPHRARLMVLTLTSIFNSFASAQACPIAHINKRCELYKAGALPVEYAANAETKRLLSTWTQAFTVSMGMSGCQSIFEANHLADTLYSRAETLPSM